MSFRFINTQIKDLVVIEPHMARDNRGYYKKIYEKNIFAQNGIGSQFTENSVVYSNRGVIRGLHYQIEESQAKLVQVIKGSIYDVSVDLRQDSPTFGKCFEILLRDEDHKAVFIPSGFAHGFQALEDGTFFSYLCSGKYIPSSCGEIRWNDSSFNINWPIKDVLELVISDKDKNAQSFKDYCIKNNIRGDRCEKGNCDGC